MLKLLVFKYQPIIFLDTQPEEEALAEARFYLQAALQQNLPKSTVMVNDFEDSKMLYNINRNTQAWVNEMRKHGYNNLMF